MLTIIMVVSKRWEPDVQEARPITEIGIRRVAHREMTLNKS